MTCFLIYRVTNGLRSLRHLGFSNVSPGCAGIDLRQEWSPWPNRAIGRPNFVQTPLLPLGRRAGESYFSSFPSGRGTVLPKRRRSAGHPYPPPPSPGSSATRSESARGRCGPARGCRRGGNGQSVPGSRDPGPPLGSGQVLVRGRAANQRLRGRAPPLPRRTVSEAELAAREAPGARRHGARQDLQTLGARRALPHIAGGPRLRRHGKR